MELVVSSVTVNAFFILGILLEKSTCSCSFGHEVWTHYLLLFENLDVACSFARGSQCLLNFGKYLRKNPLVAVVSSMNSGFLKISFWKFRRRLSFHTWWSMPSLFWELFRKNQ